MHIKSGATMRIRTPEVILAGLLAMALVGLVAGCSGGGSNGGNGSGNDGGTSLSAPAVPSGLEATSGDSEIGLSWDAVDEADTYRVYRSTSSGVGVSGSPLDTGVSSAGYTDGTAENGQTYYYVVTAVAEEGEETAESDPSSEVEKTPFSDPPDRP
jgi:hypothetical protein